MGLALVQKPTLNTPLPVASIGELSLSPTSCPSLARTEFPQLLSRKGRFQNYVVRSKFQPNFQAKQHKGRRIPLALQQRVAAELDRLISEGHVERLQGCTGDQFISPIVKTVKRDGSLKLALDSKELNKHIIKNKYQMPTIDDLIDRLAEIIHSRRSGHVRFSKIDLRYAYGHFMLATATARQCNFSVNGGRATGTNRFNTGFYGLSDMPAEFQQAIDLKLRGP